MAGTQGVAGSGGKEEKPKEEKPEEPKKKGLGIGPLSLSRASKRSRHRRPRRPAIAPSAPTALAKGGSNPSKLALPAITPAELDAFKKGIAG